MNYQSKSMQRLLFSGTKWVCHCPLLTHWNSNLLFSFYGVGVKGCFPLSSMPGELLTVRCSFPKAVELLARLLSRCPRIRLWEPIQSSSMKDLLSNRYSLDGFVSGKTTIEFGSEMADDVHLKSQRLKVGFGAGPEQGRSKNRVILKVTAWFQCAVLMRLLTAKTLP